MNKTNVAIEWSSTRLSIGWQIGRDLEEDVLTVKRFQAEQALPRLENILSHLPPVTEIRLGRGPGNYSGIRQAFAWAFGYCAPGGVALKVYSSGVAQAHRIAKTTTGPFAILGDARRGVWWGRIFGQGEDGWRVQTPAEWEQEYKEFPVFSQEASRLKQATYEVRENYPSALDLLRLPDDFTVEDQTPLYLHPAV